ncbi:MAG: hypothetical protein WCC64_22055 [Aliidongia sp.]
MSQAGIQLGRTEQTNEGASAMNSLIEPTIDHSLTIAHNHASIGDVAHGLLAALRRVRWVVDEVGGHTLVSMLDGAIRDRLIIRHLRNARCGEIEIPASMPRPGADSAAAETIMVNAAETCMVYAAEKSDTSDLMLTVFILLDRLTETLHCAPRYAELMDWLRLGEETMGDIGDAEAVGKPTILH